jgi:hypothetical protein
LSKRGQQAYLELSVWGLKQGVLKLLACDGGNQQNNSAMMQTNHARISSFPHAMAYSATALFT